MACALSMQLAMPDVNQRLRSKGGTQLEMGIGIHTGPVVVGNIGSLRRTKYGSVGSNVNLAGRIESFTTGGQILVSDRTREKAACPLRVDGQYEVEPKGAKRRIKLFEIGGIGAPFNLALPTRSTAQFPLPQPATIQFTVLEEKFVGRTVYSGKLVSVSDSEAVIESELKLTPLSNLKIELKANAGTNPGGEIYAKVSGERPAGSGKTRLRFTSLSPELKTWVHELTANLSPKAAPGEPQSAAAKQTTGI